MSGFVLENADVKVSVLKCLSRMVDCYTGKVSSNHQNLSVLLNSC